MPFARVEHDHPADDLPITRDFVVIAFNHERERVIDQIVAGRTAQRNAIETSIVVECRYRGGGQRRSIGRVSAIYCDVHRLKFAFAYKHKRQGLA